MTGHSPDRTAHHGFAKIARGHALLEAVVEVGRTAAASVDEPVAGEAVLVERVPREECLARDGRSLRGIPTVGRLDMNHRGSSGLKWFWNVAATSVVASLEAAEVVPVGSAASVDEGLAFLRGRVEGESEHVTSATLTSL